MELMARMVMLDFYVTTPKTKKKLKHSYRQAILFGFPGDEMFTP